MPTARDDAREARQAAAIALRLKGRSYRDIGRELGISRQTAYNYVQAELNEIREQAQEDAREVLTLELMKLDRCEEMVAAHIEDGNLAAADRWVKLIDQRAKLLRLYEPAGGNTQPPTINVNVSRLTTKVVPDADADDDPETDE